MEVLTEYEEMRKDVDGKAQKIFDGVLKAIDVKENDGQKMTLEQKGMLA